MSGLAVFVPGIPVPQGSMRGYVRGGRVALTSDNPGLRSWRADVTDALAKARGDQLTGAVYLGCHFLLRRPASHFGKRGLLPSAPEYPTGARSDLDKLVRAIGDAATAAGVWRDDGQVVRIVATKGWAELGDGPGVEITIRPLEAQR